MAKLLPVLTTAQLKICIKVNRVLNILDGEEALCGIYLVYEKRIRISKQKKKQM
jgi:hypothetical protein